MVAASCRPYPPLCCRWGARGRMVGKAQAWTNRGVRRETRREMILTTCLVCSCARRNPPEQTQQRGDRGTLLCAKASASECHVNMRIYNSTRVESRDLQAVVACIHVSLGTTCQVPRAEIKSAHRTALCCLGGGRQCRRGLQPPPRAAGCGASCRARRRRSRMRGMHAQAWGGRC